MVVFRGTSHPAGYLASGEESGDGGHGLDWLLLRVDLPADAVAVPLAEPAEIDAIDRAVTDALDDRHVAVWALTFPQTAARTPPRPGMTRGERFTSRGYLKSDHAYREAILLALRHDLLYDDLAPQPPPRWSGDVDAAWNDIVNGDIRRLYDGYHHDGRVVSYHSADYAPGSSGGGVVLESSGHLLGIIPRGATPVSRLERYPGFGQALRVDAICRSAAARHALPACEKFPIVDGRRAE
jgi:hypothetical protein